MTVKEWLTDSSAALQKSGITTARLDAQLLLADELAKNKAWLLAHPATTLTKSQLTHLEQTLMRRTAREPMAYIRGRQEFYDREFFVDRHVLIPRPESEALIEFLGTLNPEGVVVDVGTGSGCLAITAALEWPRLEVCATDVSAEALAVAKRNARELNARVQFQQSDLLSDFDKPAHYILANLPYVDRAWQRSAETNHEPALALFAAENGLQLIGQLLPQAARILPASGYLLLEADPRQHAAIVHAAQEKGFRSVHQRDFALVLQRI